MAEFIFYFPVILFKNYFFIIPIISLLMIFFVFKNEFDYKTSLLIFYIQICNLVFVELSSAGSDFMLIGASYLLGIYLLKKPLIRTIIFFYNIIYIIIFSSMEVDLYFSLTSSKFFIFLFICQ